MKARLKRPKRQITLSSILGTKSTLHPSRLRGGHRRTRPNVHGFGRRLGHPRVTAHVCAFCLVHAKSRLNALWCASQLTPRTTFDLNWVAIFITHHVSRTANHCKLPTAYGFASYGAASRDVNGQWNSLSLWSHGDWPATCPSMLLLCMFTTCNT